MTYKKKYHLALTPKAHTRLKVLAAKVKCAPGDVVEALVSLVDQMPERNILDALEVATYRPQAGWAANEDGKIPVIQALLGQEEE